MQQVVAGHRQQRRASTFAARPRNKGARSPADPPTVEEIVAVMRQAGETSHGLRMRGLIVMLWRAGLRIHEALPAQRGRSRLPLPFWSGAARATSATPTAVCLEATWRQPVAERTRSGPASCPALFW